MAHFPPYPRRPHVGSGQARIKVGGRVVYLGLFGSEASRQEYARRLALWQAGLAEVRAAAVGGPTVAGAVGLWEAEVAPRYRRPDGSEATEAQNTRYALRPLLDRFAAVPVALLSCRDLAEYRRLRLRTHNRAATNRDTVRVRTALRRLELLGLVPEGTWGRLKALPPLGRGEDGAREGAGRRVPTLADVCHARARLHAPHLRAAVLVQLWSGARPSELLGLTAGQLRPLGPVTVAELTRHKTAHRGHRRRLVFGPLALANLAPLLAGCAPDGHVFSPARSRAALQAVRRAKRRTRVQPSQKCRKKAGAAKAPGDRYRCGLYSARLRAACVAAGVEPFSPRGLRRLCASRVAAHPDGGDDLARLVLGHALPGVTGRYVRDDAARVEAWMRKHG